jgi:hypothetical protein
MGKRKAQSSSLSITKRDRQRHGNGLSDRERDGHCNRDRNCNGNALKAVLISGFRRFLPDKIR